MTAATRLLSLAVLASAALAPAASASTAHCNVPITTSDGAVLRANVWLPDDPAAKVPTVLTVTGYNKDTTNPLGTGCSGAGGIATADTSLTDKGYAVMLVDDRGTGASQGKWDSWGARTQRDYREVLDWIQAQPWSDGSVAATGASYMGITSFLVAEADAARVKAGKPRAVKAIWADVPMSDAYRDVTFHGGAVDAGFIPLWLGLTTSLSSLPPSTLTSDPQGSLPTWLDHLRNGFDFAGQKIADTTTAGDSAYDGPFYRLRSPGDRAAQIKIPVVITGGWWDIFQRGEPRLYEQLVNAPVKKLFMSPHYHTTSGPAGEFPDLKTKWFDRWLKGAQNGVEDIPSVNLYTMGADAWQHFTRWPVPGAKLRRAYLGENKSLAFSAPQQGGADAMPMLPASSPCSRMTTQWTAGAAAGPCETDNRTYEATSLTYTTAPLENDLQVTGPIVANVWAELTTKDATLTAVLSEVDPSGASNQISAGFLLASQRKVDATKSTYGPGKVMIRPYHPFTRESQKLVVANDPALYRIEIYPTSNRFKKGDSIRVTIGSANTPTTLTPLPDMANELGGDLRVLRGGPYKSHVLLPVVDAQS
ncbi:MAG: CocE/NonD family hydrolase [Solirubrobacteraceae bacterium]